MLLYWIDKERFAGASSPSLEDFPFLKSFEWGGLVCLESQPTSEELTFLLDIPFCHTPVEDYTSPTETDLKKIISFFKECQEKNPRFPILIHCSAGQGRTGTILAALLVLLDDLSPEDAIRTVRSINPLAIETKEQEKFIYNISEVR